MKKIRRLFSIYSLTEDNWKKHANPWCVLTRYASLPLIMLAFWSRIWIDWWAVIPILIALGWTVLNPWLFKDAVSTNNWASKSVIGELILQNTDRINIPDQHKNFARILKNIFMLGLMLSIIAISILDIWMAVLSVLVVYASRSWFMDRMVWLYEDMKNIPEYEKMVY
ncbi:MAG: hypothetical protein GX226_01485 [Dehalococcoidales bacterium]|nr:hypothetical protein [Dehalococcoidales bacterium]